MLDPNNCVFFSFCFCFILGCVDVVSSIRHLTLDDETGRNEYEDSQLKIAQELDIHLSQAPGAGHRIAF